MLDHVEWEDAVMQEEIFGPILPVLTYEKLEDALSWINQRPKPLALYCFTENKKVKKTVLERCRFGGGCIKDTLIHLATSEMPFGGVGESGMGGITVRPDLRNSRISAASWIKRHGWIFRSAISRIQQKS